MKSLAMIKFNRFSPSALPPDYYSKLNILNKNILYITHQVDKILNILQEHINDKNLETQVDKFYEMDAGNGIVDKNDSD